MAESFPRQYARTRGFNLGSPRSFAVATDGSRVAFLRTAAGDSPTASLWVYDVGADRERVVFDPSDRSEQRITAEERDRRERTGEKQTGVVAFAADPALTVASFVVGERLLLADLTGGDGVRELTTVGPAFDPRPDPTGRRVAYVTGGALHVIDLDTGADRELASDPDADVHWGLAEFVAAEEMGRHRGYRWAPDGERILAARVDERAVRVWYVTSPIDPASAPRPVRYPQAGTANADVSLHLIDMIGAHVDVGWDRLRFEYVASADWPDEGGPLVLVQSRDQRDTRALSVDIASGDTAVIAEDHDEDWTSLLPGVPARLADGRLLTTAVRDDAQALLIDGETATPPGLQVASVVDVGDVVTFTGTQEPTQMHAWRLDPRDGVITRLTHAVGVHGVEAGGDLMVVVSETPDSPSVAVLRRSDEPIHTFASLAETPSLSASPTFVSLGKDELRAVVLTPGGVEPDHPLPVLLDPYGGPGHRRVVRASRAHLEAQWFADQGFVVLIADGRGTPYRGAAWERSVRGRYLDPALEDQVDALHAAAERFGFLDLTKVAMRGWSYGGGLVLAALLRRPDVFRAGISGAPVTDMRLYDTHYTERYLGTPATESAAYEGADLVKDAAALRGELLLVHGIADDNVYVAHSLRMSKALMEEGRRHSMIPLSGITHRPTDEASAEHMLNIEVDFLYHALDVPPPGTADTPR